jgi:hypothetical protein
MLKPKKNKKKQVKNLLDVVDNLRKEIKEILSEADLIAAMLVSYLSDAITEKRHHRKKRATHRRKHSEGGTGHINKI